MQNSAATVPSEGEQGALWRLQGIFFEPRKTFESIKRRPSFLLPLVLCIIIGMASAAVVFSRVDLVDIMEDQMRSSAAGQRLTEEQIQQQLEAFSGGPLYTITKWGPPLIGAPLMVFVVAGLMLLMVYVGGSETSYMKLVGVTSHTYFFYYLVQSGLTAIVYWFSNDPTSIDIQNPVATNLGHVFDSSEAPILNKVFSSIDLITIYVIYLLGLGMACMSTKMKAAKGVALIACLYTIYAGIGIAWRAIMG